MAQGELPRGLEWDGYDGAFAPGMTICIESYVGAVGERDGVKLEQMMLITDTGAECLSTYPLDEKLSSVA